MTGRVDVLIAGGGVLGSAIAWALSQRGIGDVCVVDVDLSHRRTAPMHARPVRALWDQEVNVRACLASRGFFRERAEQLDFRSHGHVWIYESSDALAQARDAAAERQALGLELETWSGFELGKRFPALDRAAEEVAGALYSPADGLVDPSRVRALFRERASAAGVRFLDGHYIHGLATSEREPGRRRLERVDLWRLAPLAHTSKCPELMQLLTTHSLPHGVDARPTSIRPGIVINALGAWSSLFVARLGPMPVSFPCRRQLCTLALGGRSDERPGSEWPALVADPSGAFFHPDSAYIVAGVDARVGPAGFDFTYAGERYFQNRLWPHLAQRASAFEKVHHVRGACSLDPLTPDGSGVLGWLPGFSNVLEAYGFPGSGIMHAFAAARGLAELIVDGRYETLDLEAFSRTRFAASERLLPEKHRV